ncbi:MAG TPA: hypothetical protein VGO11_24610 [Chthoniobacteraceae bacterium]|jgi:hypothetical protein|nr:hypothetical protein [Chthoniobacteraceae bacterium]
MKTSILLLLSSLACTLSGCIIPYPHTSQRFSGVSGHVRDARTHRPISGVGVALHQHPSTRTTTDADGAYHLDAQKNFHLFFMPGPCGASLPMGEQWSVMLDFTHPGYRPFSFEDPEPWKRREGELFHAEVLLNRK